MGNNGQVEQRTFNDYPLTKIARVPSLFEAQEMNYDITPTGVGEIGVPSAAPALTNAIFNAAIIRDIQPDIFHIRNINCNWFNFSA